MPGRLHSLLALRAEGRSIMKCTRADSEVFCFPFLFLIPEDWFIWLREYFLSYVTQYLAQNSSGQSQQIPFHSTMQTAA
jgi:hypothetical protein